MKIRATLLRCGVLCGSLLFLFGTRAVLLAQAAPETPPAAKTASPEDLSQAELLKSYLQIREQLQATQLTIAKDRLEAEAAARAQTAAITEKLESIKSAMEAERERHRVETDQANAERERYRAEMLRINTEHERQRAEMERSNRFVLWIAGAFGGLGLLAILITPLFQWRTLNRMTEMVAPRPQLPPGAPQGLLPEGNVAADQTVALSNQRLMTAIERVERRISDFEQSWSRTPAATTNGSGDSTRRAIANEQLSRIGTLLAKGQTLLDAGKPMDAMACYNEILRIDLNHPEALVKRGLVLERLKQDDEAIQCYDRAIKADRKMTLAYLHKGAVCNRLERYEEALKCYQQALQVEEEGR